MTGRLRPPARSLWKAEPRTPDRQPTAAAASPPAARVSLRAAGTPGGLLRPHPAGPKGGLVSGSSLGRSPGGFGRRGGPEGRRTWAQQRDDPAAHTGPGARARGHWDRATLGRRFPAPQPRCPRLLPGAEDAQAVPVNDAVALAKGGVAVNSPLAAAVLPQRRRQGESTNTLTAKGPTAALFSFSYSAPTAAASAILGSHCGGRRWGGGDCRGGRRAVRHARSPQQRPRALRARTPRNPSRNAIKALDWSHVIHRSPWRHLEFFSRARITQTCNRRLQFPECQLRRRRRVKGAAQQRKGKNYNSQHAVRFLALLPERESRRLRRSVGSHPGPLDMEWRLFSGFP